MAPYLHALAKELEPKEGIFAPPSPFLRLGQRPRMRVEISKWITYRELYIILVVDEWKARKAKVSLARRLFGNSLAPGRLIPADAVVDKFQTRFGGA